MLFDIVNIDLKVKPDESHKQIYINQQKLNTDQNVKSALPRNDNVQIANESANNRILGHSEMIQSQFYPYQYQDPINWSSVGLFKMIKSNFIEQNGNIYINQNVEFQNQPSSIAFNIMNINNSQIPDQQIFQKNNNYQYDLRNTMNKSLKQSLIFFQQGDMNMNKSIEIDMEYQNQIQDQQLHNQPPQQHQQQQQQMSQFYHNNNTNFPSIQQSSNQLAKSKHSIQKYFMNVSRHLDQSKNIESQIKLNKVLGGSNFCLIDSQKLANVDARSETVNEDNRDDLDDFELSEEYRAKSTQDLEGGFIDLNFQQSIIQQPQVLIQEQRANHVVVPQQNNFTISGSHNEDDFNSNQDNTSQNQNVTQNIANRVPLVQKTIKATRQKKDQDNQYRQSKHKNVFKNFGCTLIRFIMYNPHFRDRLNTEFKEVQSEIKDFEDWLQFTAKLTNKTQFLNAWTTFKSDTQQVRNYKDILKELARDFFENFSLIYLMNTKKISNFEIHLRSIYTYLSALNNPDNLEKFKPVPYDNLI